MDEDSTIPEETASIKQDAKATAIAMFTRKAVTFCEPGRCAKKYIYVLVLVIVPLSLYICGSSTQLYVNVYPYNVHIERDAFYWISTQAVHLGAFLCKSSF